MAGVRQHILPKFLQKGFTSRIKKKQTYTWVYRKNTEPFEVNIDHINAERQFYGKEGESNADDGITELEATKLSPLIDELREGTVNFDERGDEIAELVAHFSIRTKVVRKGLEDLSNKMVGGLTEILADGKVIEETFLNPSKDVFEKLLDDPDVDEELKSMFQMLKALGIDELAREPLKDQNTKKRSKRS